MSDAKSDVGGKHDLAQSLAQIIGRLAHDLKNPLAVVLSNLRFLETQLEDLDLREAAMESAVSAERLSRMIDDVVDLETVRSSGRRPVPDGRPLSDLGRQAEQAVSQQLGSRRLELDLPDTPLATEFPMLSRVVINILEHSIRRTASRGLIRLEAEAADSSVTIRVLDQGPPFSTDRAPSFLATDLPDMRAPQEGCRSDQGMGLFFAGTAARWLGARCSVDDRSDQAGVVFSLVFDTPTS